MLVIAVQHRPIFPSLEAQPSNIDCCYAQRIAMHGIRRTLNRTDGSHRVNLHPLFRVFFPLFASRITTKKASETQS
jgi:hypothetical protein